MKAHVDAPAVLNAPSGQLVQEDTSAAPYVPAGQLLQDDAPGVLNLPAGQGIGALASGGQNEAAGHASAVRLYTMPVRLEFNGSLKKHTPNCAPYSEKYGPNEGGPRPLANATRVPEAPVRRQEELVATEAPAAAVYTIAKS